MRSGRCLIFLSLFAGCRSAAREVPLRVHTDVAGLAERLSLPVGVRSARWLVVASGSSGSLAPGPTDTTLFALVELEGDAWTALQGRAGTATQEVPEEVARVLFVPDALAALQAHAGGRRIQGRRYDVQAWSKNPYSGDEALRLGDALFLAMTTR